MILLCSPQTDDIWLGLTDLDVKGVWRWEDGYVLGWGRWQPSRPDADNNCAARDSAKYLHDHLCDHVDDYAQTVCEYDKGIIVMI